MAALPDDTLTKVQSLQTRPDLDVELLSSPVTPLLPATTACVNKRFWNLEFGTIVNGTRFGNGVSTDSTSTLFALSVPTASRSGQSPRIKKSFSDIIKAVGILDQSKGDTDSLPKGLRYFWTLASHLNSVDFVLTEDQQQTPVLPDPSADEVRNGMWIADSNVVEVDTALTFSPVSTDASSLAAKIKDIIPLKFSDSDIGAPLLIVRRKVYASKITSLSDTDPTETETWSTWSTSELVWKITIKGFVLWIVLSSGYGSVSLTPATDSGSEDNIKAILDGISDDPIFPEADTILSNIRFLRLQLGLRGSSVFWEVVTAVHLSDVGPDLYLKYNSENATFAGGLILSDFYASSKLSPYFKPGRDEISPIGQTVPRSWDLRGAFPTIKIPSALPTDIVFASISYRRSKGTTPATFSFKARSRYHADDPSTFEEPKDDSVPSPFIWNELSVSFTKSGPNVECSLDTTFTLNPPNGADQSILPASMALSFKYDSHAGWMLRGRVNDLSCGLLYSFFDSDSQDAAFDIFRKLNIASLDLLWTHNKAGGSAAFLFSGIITFGELRLRLFYQFTTQNATADTNKALQTELDAKKVQGSSGRSPPKALAKPSPGKESTWSFECDLETTTDNATIGSIAESILDDAADILPPFVYNIPIPRPENGSGESPIMIRAAKAPLNPGGPLNRLIFVFRFAIGIFSATFVQVADANKGSARGETKRMLRFEVGKLPIKGNIPLLDRLPQPFDKLEYAWVSGSGFTKQEIDMVNDSGLLPQSDQILVKAFTSTTGPQDSPSRPDNTPSAKPSPTNPTVLQGGHHFMVIQSGQVSLDHVFNASPSKTTDVPASLDLEPQGGEVMAVAPPGTPAASQPSKGSVGLKLGPLSITGITLQYKEQAGKKALWITLDATFALGPISLSLYGFGLIITFGEKVTLSNLISAVDDIDITLDGMSVSFNKPPLLIAGGFEHKKTASLDAYLGAIGVGFPPYTFLGMGEYAQVDLNNQKYKSIFLYCKLDGPLITLEFATITGVRLGFGYNSFIESPDLSDLTDFPFINDDSSSGAGTDPMAILKKLTEPSTAGKTWVSPKLDSYWLAAGLSITAFDLLTITAMIIVKFGSPGFAISLIADAIATMPPKAPHGVAIVYVELTIKTEMNFATGLFSVMAAFAPTSYLLVPQCSIHGQMAMCYWFPPSDHAGDWVLSVGGYHRAYQRPPHYPPVERLGISFNIDVISIEGQAYFALTPKCVMGGALIHASLEFGPLYAWMDFTFDAFINFHPLHYTVDMSLTIGVRSHIELIFINSHHGATVGVQLHIEGPEFGGKAHVTFFIFSFDFDFGSPPKQPDPLSLNEFFEMVHKPGPEATGSGEHKGAVVTTNTTWTWTLVPNKSKKKPDDPDLVPQQVPQFYTLDGAAFKFVLEDGNFPMPGSLDKTDSSTTSKDPESTGAGAKWFVKGGTFVFRIRGDYAINDATVSKDASDSNSLRHFDGSSGTKASIFSKPMHMTQAMGSATSTLAIQVQRFSKDLKTGIITIEETISAWKTFTLLYEPMPTAIWSVYDSNSDPSRGNSRPSDLLTGTNSTVNQAMGVRFTPPEPILCPRPEWPGFIPKVRATGMAKFGILDFRTNPIDGDDWYLPSANTKQVKFLPAVPTSTQTASTKQQQWTDFASSWSSFESFEDVHGKKKIAADPGATRRREAAGDEGEDGGGRVRIDTTQPPETEEQKKANAVETQQRQGRIDVVSALLAGVAQVCQWDQKRPQMSPAEEAADAVRVADTGLQAWQLTGAVPKKLVKDIKRAYLDLPQYGVVSG